ncbi:Fatty acid desaturase [Mycobacterium lentiflavum]|uniref:Fatty acid desaturase n=1 Tax=Mycobacterium lentiflavum TaxID=141349 RepID=A0A0E4GZT9_MYCLN|nr:fatty acid desaturase [Mycobacterium lentiflavum]CQD19022.1 Fatty acid desaturase [Mycobacterium lentiflavum]
MALVHSSVWRATQDGGSGRVTSCVVVATLAGLVLQLVVLPLWMLPADAAFGWLLVPIALLSMPFWSLIHEAIHGTLIGHRPWNDRFGRVLAIGYGAPFVLLKSAHLLHHRYNRTRRERTEIYDPATSSWAAAAPGYYLHLLGGLYVIEAASVLLVAAPRRLWRYLARLLDSPDTFAGMLLEGISRRHLREFRADAVSVVLVYVAAGFAYGRHVWMLVAALVARAVLISIADNAYHYGTRLDARLEALNLRLPGLLERLLLAFNLHGVHHRHPGLPWYELRSAFLADGDEFHLGWFTATARQLRGPISADAPGLRQPNVVEHSTEQR